MIDRVSERKLSELRKFEKKYRHVIKDCDFKPGTLVQVRNTRIEKNLDRKMYDRYLGPLVVIGRSRGGAYAIAELDGSVFDKKVAAFRVVPYFARKEIELPKDLGDFIDISMRKLEDLIDSEDPVSNTEDYSFSGIKLQDEADSENEEYVDDDTGDEQDNTSNDRLEDEDSDEDDETPVSSRLRKRK